MEIRKVEYKDEKDEKRKKGAGKDQMLPENNNVAKDKQGRRDRRKNGITWIELYALYMCKGAGDPIREEEKNNPLKKKQRLQKALAAFKVECRRVKDFCIKEGEEHHLATSYCQVNRLGKLGIENKHAAIRGRPVLDDEDRKAITQAILAMRGMNQKTKDEEKHEAGTLQLPMRTMTYKRKCHGMDAELET